MKKWLIAFALSLTGLSSAAPRESRVLLDLAAPDFLLTSHQGKAVKLEDFKGKHAAGYFGTCQKSLQRRD